MKKKLCAILQKKHSGVSPLALEIVLSGANTLREAQGRMRCCQTLFRQFTIEQPSGDSLELLQPTPPLAEPSPPSVGFTHSISSESHPGFKRAQITSAFQFTVRKADEEQRSLNLIQDYSSRDYREKVLIPRINEQGYIDCINVDFENPLQPVEMESDSIEMTEEYDLEAPSEWLAPLEINRESYFQLPNLSTDDTVMSCQWEGKQNPETTPTVYRSSASGLYYLKDPGCEFFCSLYFPKKYSQ